MPTRILRNHRSERGKLADYIPEFSHVDPQPFGISPATVDD